MLQNISTIITDLGKDITDRLFGIFDSSQLESLRKQEAELRQSLEERRGEWEAYQRDIADKLQQAQEDYQSTIEEAERKYRESIDARREKYEEDQQNLRDSLTEKVADFEEYKTEVFAKIEAITEKNREELAKRLGDLRKQLEDATKRYRQAMEDDKTRLKRAVRDNKEAIRDKQRATERALEDEDRKYRRYIEDRQRKIQRLLQEGKDANSEEIRDLQRSIERRTQDHELYVQRKKEDLEEFVRDHNRHLQDIEADIAKSMERRKQKYDEYVQTNKAKQQEITNDAAEELNKQVTDLQNSLAEREAALEAFKNETAEKLAASTADWEQYKNDAAAKLEDLKTAAKEKLDQQTADLQAALDEERGKWDSFVDDVSDKLDQIDKDKKGQSIFNRVKDAFSGMLEDMGKAVVRTGLESILQGLIDKLVGKDGLMSAIKSVGGLLGRVFGGGGGAAATSTVPELLPWMTEPGMPAPPPPGAPSPGGGAGGAISGAGGPLGWANLGVTVANGIVAGFQRARQETTLNAIEENTRRGTQYLGDRADGGIMTASLKSLEQLGYEVANTDNIKTSLWNLESVFTSTGSLLMTRLNSIRAATETSASKLDDMKLGIDGANLSLDILHQDLFALGTYLYQMDTNLGFQVASTDSIKEALWGIKEYAFAVAGNINPIKELLGQIRDARSITVNVNAQTNASPEEIADAIASTLRTQGVVA